MCSRISVGLTVQHQTPSHFIDLRVEEISLTGQLFNELLAIKCKVKY